MSFEETSKVMILYSLSPVITLVLSYLFLGERITLIQLFGFLLILVSVVGVSINLKEVHFSFSKSLFYVGAAASCWSVASVIFKYVVDQTSFVKVISYESWGVALGGLTVYFLIAPIRRGVRDEIKSFSIRTPIAIISNETIYITARVLSFLAISLGPLSLVSIIGNTNVFFGLIFGTLLTILFPNVFNEDISKNILLKKSLFALLAFGGITLISL